MNITDVGHIVGDVDEGEDRMMLAAKREGRDPETLARKYTDQFMADRRKLNILDPHVMPKATEHIPEMIALIQRLIAKDQAYVAADGVYFDIATFPGYGTRLAGERTEDLVAGARVDVNPNKRNPADFALWRAKKPGDLQFWDSPWGQGNPGWHIECSAMSMKYLGETFDIHSGGEDNLFPHHESEIAQSEAATGKPFVRYWTHVRFLKVDGGAMHKSAGNAYLLRDLESWGFEPLAFRMLVLEQQVPAAARLHARRVCRRRRTDSIAGAASSATRGSDRRYADRRRAGGPETRGLRRRLDRRPQHPGGARAGRGGARSRRDRRRRDEAPRARGALRHGPGPGAVAARARERCRPLRRRDAPRSPSATRHAKQVTTSARTSFARSSSVDTGSA